MNDDDNNFTAPAGVNIYAADDSSYNQVFGTIANQSKILSPTEAINMADKGLAITHVTDAIDPKKSSETGSLFNIDFRGKLNTGMAKFFEPLNKLVKPNGAAINAKKIGGLGGIFVASKADGESKSVSQSLADLVSNSEFSTLADGGLWLDRFDGLIASSFPMAAGITPLALVKHAMKPNVYYDPDSDEYVKWEDPQKDIGMAYLAQDKIHGLAGFADGVDFLTPSAWHFSQIPDRLTERQAASIFNQQSNQFGSSCWGLGKSKGTLDLPREAITGDYTVDYFIRTLSSNYREKNKTYDDLLQLAEVSNPYWDVKKRHEFYFEGLQKLKLTTANFIDGAGDFVRETFDNFNNTVINTVDNAFNFVNNTLASYGFDVMLNPKIKENVDKFFGKVGFAKNKTGSTDYEGYPSNSVMYSTILFINGVQIPPEYVIGYYEEHDYINANYPIRRIRVRIPATFRLDKDIEKQLNPANLGKDENSPEAYDIVLSRTYGFSRSQNYSHFTFDGYALFRPFESLIGYEGRPNITKWSKEVDDEMKAKLLKDETLLAETSLTEDLEITITGPYDGLLNGPAKDYMQGPVKEDTTIETVIMETFKRHFIGAESNPDAQVQSPLKLALTKPEVSTELRGILTPMNFPQILDYYQQETGGRLFNGGYNIYVQYETVFVLNKKGPNKIKFDTDWQVTLSFQPQVTLVDTLYTAFSINEQKITIGMWYEDLMKLGEFESFNEEKVMLNRTGSSVNVTDVTDGSAKNVKVVNTTVDAQVEEPIKVLKTHEFLVRIPNTYVIFTPGDDITLFIPTEKGKQKFVGTVKKWASESNQEMRCVVLVVSLNEASIEKLTEFYGDTPAAELAAQSPMEKAITKFQEKCTQLSDASMNWFDKVQEKYKDGVAGKGYDSGAYSNPYANESGDAMGDLNNNIAMDLKDIRVAAVPNFGLANDAGGFNMRQKGSSADKFVSDLGMYNNGGF